MLSLSAIAQAAARLIAECRMQIADPKSEIRIPQ